MSMIPVVLLCGGRGVVLDGSGRRRAKGLVPIAGEEMFLHVARSYARAGFRRFILAAGAQAGEFREVLAKRSSSPAAAGQDFALELEGARCEIRVVDTGADAATGTRLNRVRVLVSDAPWFCATYSDTLCAADLKKLADFHLHEGRIATLIAARVPTRFRVLGLRDGENVVRGFAGKSVLQKDFINGGFYCFDQKIFGPEYLGAREEIVLEEAVLEALVRDRQLLAWPYEGPWQHLDSERDIARLEAMRAQPQAA